LRVLTTAEQRVAELSDWIESLKGALLTPPPSLTPESYDDTERRGTTLERLDLQQLSTREREVLDDLAKGRQAQEIAANLGVSISTVRTHIRSIFVKLKVNSQLALLARLVSDAPSTPPARRS
jgi:DNA-binding NarL/FixJ family response regulator